MRRIRIAGLLAAGLMLAACSPEAPRDAAPGSSGTAAATEETPADRAPPAVKAAPPERPEPAPEIDPDPQAGVELPTPPVRVPED